MEICVQGSTRVGVIKNKKFNTLNLHIANINQIIKYSKVYLEMEFLKDLRSIINYSLIIISKTSHLETVKSFKAFEVIFFILF